MKFNLKLFVLVGVLAGFRDVYGTDEVKNEDDAGFYVNDAARDNADLAGAVNGMRVIRAVYKTEFSDYVFIINKAFQDKLFKVLVYAGKEDAGVDVGITTLDGDGNRLYYNMHEEVDYSVYFIFKEELFNGIEGNLLLNSTASMFQECRALIHADLSNFSAKDIKDMSYMFSNCYSLKNLNLSSFNTQNVKNMSGMFSNCAALPKLDLSKFDTKNVTNMSNMFSGCWALTELDLSKFDTQNVENMSCMFYNCAALPKLDLSKFNTTKVTDMSSMFEWCEVLKELNLSNFDFSKVNDMVNMFLNCKIKNLFLPQKYKDIRKRCICCGYVYINDEAVVGLNPNNVEFV